MSEMLSNCARELIETSPKIVQAFRVEMRTGHSSELTIPQFRTLRYVQKNPETSLSSVAEFLGLTLPTTSKLVDGLVRQALIIRKVSSLDRRFVTLLVSPLGESIVNKSRAESQKKFEEKLSTMSENDLELILKSLSLLNQIFICN